MSTNGPSLKRSLLKELITLQVQKLPSIMKWLPSCNKIRKKPLNYIIMETSSCKVRGKSAKITAEIREKQDSENVNNETNFHSLMEFY